MAPIRRYLRITKRSVLEVRIYLDKPSEASWILSSRDPVLARIMQAIRPKVLPKLREENENARKKSGKKKKGIKDVVSTEEFEVVIFLKELSTRHSLLTKQKHFVDKPRLKSTGNKLTGWLNNAESPIDVDEERPTNLRDENDDEVVELYAVPEANAGNKRKAAGEGEDGLFVSEDEDDAFQTQAPPESKRQRRSSRPQQQDDEEEEEEGGEDKKKLGMNTSYDGFSIYGRTLCLVVKRKGKKATPADASVGGSQMMEHWISTQAAQESGLDEEDEG